MQFWNYVWKYVCALWLEWKLLLTGGSLITIILICNFVGKFVLPQYVYWITLIITFIIASFLIWKKEYQEKEGFEEILRKNKDDKQTILSQKIGQALQIRFIAAKGLYYTIEHGRIERCDSHMALICDNLDSCWSIPLANIEIGGRSESIIVRAESIIPDQEHILCMLERWRLWTLSQPPEVKFDRGQYLMQQFLSQPKLFLPTVNTMRAESRDPWDHMSAHLRLEIKRQEDHLTFDQKMDQGHKMERAALSEAHNTGMFNGPESIGAHRVWNEQVKFVVDSATSKSEAIKLLDSFKLRAPDSIREKQVQDIMLGLGIN